VSVRILTGHVLDRLAEFPDESVQCVVTSPPYWGLRDYGIKPQVWGGDRDCAHLWGDHTRTAWANSVHGPNGRAKNGDAYQCDVKWTGPFCSICGAWRGSLGLEPTYALYVEHMVEVFRAVRRVLRADGTLWLNLGDSYATGAGKVGACPGGGEQGEWKGNRGVHSAAQSGKHGPRIEQMGPMTQPNRMPQPGLKPKDLCGIPWRVAFALQDDGWWLRQDIIWSKPNPMPESIRDRCTKAHEYLFLLSKSARYHFGADAIAESSITEAPRRPYTSEGAWQLDGRPADQRHGGKPRTIKTPDGWDTGSGGNGREKGKTHARTAGNKSHKYVTAYEGSDAEEHRTKAGLMAVADVPWEKRNKRSVWTIATAPFPEAHFATFPPALVEPCILAGCPEGGTVLDPFGGSGTVGLVADRLGRNSVLIELNIDYAAMARRRIENDAGMFAEVAE
jgi:DNA modification methylase